MTYSQYKPTYTKSAVVIAGSLVSSQHNVDTKKYKRKDCPVCKGKGYYISGDGISRVTCGYCEPAEKDGAPAYDNKIITHPPAILKSNCISGTCNSVRK